MHQITESSTIITASQGKLSKQLEVFYNPIMKFNRDTSILLLNALNRKHLQIADPLAGSGIRSIRFINELNREIIKSISINDSSKSAVKAIKNNLKLNKIKNITITNKDANEFILNSKGFDYIDIDPFGSPNPFLDAAIKRLSRTGILAVTATDTAPLAGTYQKACKRKYWATPLRNHLMHEVGLRILIRKVQLIAAQYDKALVPVLSYSKDHYYRIFFQSEKSKTECDKILKQHKTFIYCPHCTAYGIEKHCSCKNMPQLVGPLWIGQLHDKKIIAKMVRLTKEKETKKFLHTIKQEANMVGFYDLHILSKKTKTQPQKTADVIKKLRQKGFIATPTHFSAHAIKTDAKVKELTQSLSSHQSLHMS